jgi:hypothetical protein
MAMAESDMLCAGQPGFGRRSFRQISGSCATFTERMGLSRS